MNLVPDIATVVQNMERKVNFKVGTIPRLHSLLYSLSRPFFVYDGRNSLVGSFIHLSHSLKRFLHCVCSNRIVSSPNSKSGLAGNVPISKMKSFLQLENGIPFPSAEQFCIRLNTVRKSRWKCFLSMSFKNVGG
jgi:hypothetical protein